jgi:hypothetical protein
MLVQYVNGSFAIIRAMCMCDMPACMFTCVICVIVQYVYCTCVICVLVQYVYCTCVICVLVQYVYSTCVICVLEYGHVWNVGEFESDWKSWSMQITRLTNSNSIRGASLELDLCAMRYSMSYSFILYVFTCSSLGNSSISTLLSEKIAVPFCIEILLLDFQKLPICTVSKVETFCKEKKFEYNYRYLKKNMKKTRRWKCTNW